MADFGLSHCRGWICEGQVNPFGVPTGPWVIWEPFSDFANIVPSLRGDSVPARCVILKKICDCICTHYTLNGLLYAERSLRQRLASEQSAAFATVQKQEARLHEAFVSEDFANGGSHGNYCWFSVGPHHYT